MSKVTNMYTYQEFLKWKGNITKLSKDLQSFMEKWYEVIKQRDERIKELEDTVKHLQYTNIVLVNKVRELKKINIKV